MLNILKKIVIGIVYILIFFILIIGFVLITEFSPQNGEELKVIGKETKTLKVGDTVKILTYNIGHLVSDSKATCYLEGGTMVKAESKTVVQDNLEGVKKVIADSKSDIVALQEVDYKSNISHLVNEYIELANDYEGVSSIALLQNTYVPYPVDDAVGKVKTGITVMSRFNFASCRINLFEDYDFPERLFMPKKCIQKQIISLEESDKKLVVLNVELDDYDDGHVRERQLKILKDEMEKEYSKGNYVVVAGDFNMTFPDIDNTNNVKGEYVITSIDKEFLPEGWSFAIDKMLKTFRLRDEAYNAETSFTSIVDGFIVSPNITVKSTKTIDTEFKYSNHNPVQMEFVFKK